MHALFENQKEAMVEDYEKRLRDLESKKDTLFQDMKAQL